MPLLFGSGRSHEAESCDLHAALSTAWRFDPSINKKVPAALPRLIPGSESKPSRGAQLAREAVLLIFCDPLPQQCSRLQYLSRREWQHLLHWLDTSGLALYFLDRIIELELCDWLPSTVFARLQQNLKDNTERTGSMVAESVAIQREFQEAQLSYAMLKGLSLWPISVPKPELRSQFDLDFLVAEEDVPEARRILECRGYRLYAVSGKSLEFKRNERPGLSLKHLYKALPSYAVELHVESGVPGRPSLLERVEKRKLYGVNMPVLAPKDLFLRQGLHAFKHVCSEFSRTAHLLEFRRHVLARRDDQVFWNELQVMAEENPRASLGLGVITLLITRVMGDFAPTGLTKWSAHCLPRSAHLWVEIYGHRAVYGSFPGNKLYLLLQRELEAAGVPAKRSVRQALLPFRLPPPVIRAFPHEALSVRLARYRMQLSFIFLRLRFHIIEGIRYRWETHRWRRVMNRSPR